MTNESPAQETAQRAQIPQSASDAEKQISPLGGQGEKEQKTPATDTQQKALLELSERVGIVEAILFVTGNAVEKREICRAMEISEDELDRTLAALESGYDFERRGLRLLRFGEHVQLATRPEYARYVEKLLQPVQKQSLSQAIMETLAVIAYRQPVTKAEIEAVRGVKCDYSVQSLVAKGLIEEAGRKEALGRPILYGTTDAFLRHFCMTSLADLPEIDFSAIADKQSEEAGQTEQPPEEKHEEA